MSDKDLNISISNELIQPIIDAKIQTAIVMALESERENLIPKMVQAALLQKVDNTGKTSNYNSDNKYTYMEFMCNKAVQDASKAAFTDFIKEREADLKAEMMRILDTKKMKNALVKAFLDGLIGSATHNWKLNFEAKFETPKNY